MSAKLFGTSRIATAILALSVICCCFCTEVLSQQTYKKLPPAGIDVDATKLAELKLRARQLEVKIDNAAAVLGDADLWLPDIEVLRRAVSLAIQQNLFFKDGQTEAADRLLDEADRRRASVVAGNRGLSLMGFSPEQTDAPQLLVRWIHFEDR